MHYIRQTCLGKEREGKNKEGMGRRKRGGWEGKGRGEDKGEEKR